MYLLRNLDIALLVFRKYHTGISRLYKAFSLLSSLALWNYIINSNLYYFKPA